MQSPSPFEPPVCFKGGMKDAVAIWGIWCAWTGTYPPGLLFPWEEKKREEEKVSEWWPNCPIPSKTLISCTCATSVKSSRPLVSLGSQTMEKLLMRSTYIQQLQLLELQGQQVPYHVRLCGSVKQIYGHSSRLCLEHPWYLCLLPLWLWTQQGNWHLLLKAERGSFTISGCSYAWCELQQSSCLTGSGGFDLTVLTSSFAMSLMTFIPLQERPSVFKTDKNFCLVSLLLLQLSWEIISLSSN